ncbi:zona pellucida-binding protein 1 isoform X5 [Mesocricetus auratus]|uniref:Zona pellucida-binding protein 1 isoform X5 n=1 Tax=Mesocricetus auratus TaxID=10036 RepID=A0ABM2XIL3_MESAU|nr:zona pellucida-binding protein 1 isoform X5 [Mesocricetus auratus]
MGSQASARAGTPPADGPGGSGSVSAGPSFRHAVRRLPAAGGRAPGNDLLRRGSAGGGVVWMEALAPGRAPRGRRRQAGAAGSALSALSVAAVLLSALLRAPPAVGYLARLPRSFRLTQDSLKIVGSSHFPVSVYVMLHQKSPHVLCVTQRLRNTELVDPSFQWHGPKGKIVSENTTAQVTSTGSLVFQNFEETMSGVYTCFLEYKPTVEETVKNLQLKYVIYVSSIDTEKGSKPCTDHNCETSKRLSKAKNLIERFFNQQVEVLGKRVEPLPEIYYIEGTLQMVWVNRCYPGYGINALKHPKCPECCGSDLQPWILQSTGWNSLPPMQQQPGVWSEGMLIGHCLV